MKPNEKRQVEDDRKQGLAMERRMNEAMKSWGSIPKQKVLQSSEKKISSVKS
jgi:hypothetical protein